MCTEVITSRTGIGCLKPARLCLIVTSLCVGISKRWAGFERFAYGGASKGNPAQVTQFALVIVAAMLVL